MLFARWLRFWLHFFRDDGILTKKGAQSHEKRNTEFRRWRGASSPGCKENETVQDGTVAAGCARHRQKKIGMRKRWINQDGERYGSCDDLWRFAGWELIGIGI